MEKKDKVIEIREKIIWIKRTDKTENIDKRCSWEKQKRTERFQILIFATMRGNKANSSRFQTRTRWD